MKSNKLKMKTEMTSLSIDFDSKNEDLIAIYGFDIVDPDGYVVLDFVLVEEIKDIGKVPLEKKV